MNSPSSTMPILPSPISSIHWANSTNFSFSIELDENCNRMFFVNLNTLNLRQ
ncbi:hypothetical protein A2U01_0063418, partial [Trifolium medium]|nr:hypothetical protein [Trifolium medium]